MKVVNGRMNKIFVVVLFSVLKDPPFVVREQGYAGFTIFADVVMKDGKMVNLSTSTVRFQIPD